MLDHINLAVPNIEEAEDFYVNTLGFTISGDFQTPNGRYLFVSKDGVTYEIVENTELETAKVGHIALKSDDIEKDYNTLKANGAKMRGQIGQVKFIFNGAKFFFIEGVAGEPIEYIQLL